MKPAAFDYVRAADLEEILATLHEHGGEARILAGGQSLLPMLNMRLAKPAVLIDIMHVAALAQATDEPGHLVIQAAVRQSVMLARARADDDLPLLAAALPWVGHYQTRARGTICGSVAHADPSAEIPLCLVALGGEIHLRARRRRRRVAAEKFFSGTMLTTRGDAEMIEAVTWPKRRAGTGYAFAEIGRRHGDFAIVACAAVVEAAGMRLAVGGVADTPVARNLPLLDGTALDDALNALAWELPAREDMHADARTRRELVRTLGRQVLQEAASCRV